MKISYFDSARLHGIVDLPLPGAVLRLAVSTGGECSCSLLTSDPVAISNSATACLNRKLWLQDFEVAPYEGVLTPLGSRNAAELANSLLAWLAWASNSGSAAATPRILSTLRPLLFVLYGATKDENHLLIIEDRREVPSPSVSFELSPALVVAWRGLLAPIPAVASRELEIS